MDVQHAVAEAPQEGGVEQRHVPGQDHELDAVLLQPVRDRGVALRAGAEGVAREDARGDARVGRAPQRPRRGLVRGHRDDVGLVAVDRLEQRLEVRALARGEHPHPQAASRARASFG